MAHEVAEESAWFKSSYSNDTGGSCVEIAIVAKGVGVRDSKTEHGPAFLVSNGSWAAFLTSITA